MFCIRDACCYEIDVVLYLRVILSCFQISHLFLPGLRRALSIAVQKDAATLSHVKHNGEELIFSAECMLLYLELLKIKWNSQDYQRIYQISVFLRRKYVH